MKSVLLFVLIVFLSFQQAVAQAGRHSFSFSKNDFLLDGKPFQIISGEMHPARIPHEYWRHRIQMAKAMGCNTIAAYVFWNYHETMPGQFNFKTGNHDISAFIRMCQQEGLWVLLRPGPYVCAEWDFGGLPPYLLKVPDIKVRCLDKRYMAAVTRYIHHLSHEVKSLLCANGGPILMVQIENEYGSFGNSKKYLEALKQLWKSNGVNGPFYTSDGPTPYMLDAGTVPGAAIGLDSGSDSTDFSVAHHFNHNVPAFSGETYPGWLTHWGEPWARTDTAGLKKEVSFLLDYNKSFNLYVVHGGTNFGFTAGANAFSPVQYQPDVTSYDYDAPINEQGRATPKYYTLRNLIAAHVTYKLPDVPAPIPTITIPEIAMHKAHSLWDNLPKPLHSAQPKPMEAIDQNGGLLLYKTKLIRHKSGKLTITEPHDYALIFLNGMFVDTIQRDGGKWTINLPESDAANPELEILVEGMGHINFAQHMIDRKGITDRVTLNGMTLMDWDMYPLPMDEAYTKKVVQSKGVLNDNKPGIFFEGTFTLEKTGDTYFDLSNYSKGMVYVNGHNLGRYWSKGPQKRLYCPAPWLKKGSNEILVFDMHQMQVAPISGQVTLE